MNSHEGMPDPEKIKEILDVVSEKIPGLFCSPPDMDGVARKMSGPVDQQPGAERTKSAQEHQPEDRAFPLQKDPGYPILDADKPEKGQDQTDAQNREKNLLEKMERMKILPGVPGKVRKPDIEKKTVHSER